MLNEVKDRLTDLGKLRAAYESSCSGYLDELLRMWELDSHYGYWIGDEVGGVYDYGGSFTIVMDDIIYCVEHDVSEVQYQEWQDYVCDASEFGFDAPDLKSWMKGCPRVSEEVFERLCSLKSSLAKAIEDEKERLSK